MLAKQRALLDIMKEAIKLAKEGKYSGVVGSCICDPKEIMERIGMPYTYDQNTGDITAYWSDPHHLLMPEHETSLYSYLSLEANFVFMKKRQAIKEENIDRIMYIIRLALSESDILLYPKEWEVLQKDTLDQMLQVFSLKLVGASKVEACLTWEHPVEDLIRLDIKRNDRKS